MFTRIAVTFLLLAVLSTGTCQILRGAEHPDFAVDLGNGYKLVRANEYEIFVSDDTDRVVVPGKITAYAIKEGVVVGHVQMPDWTDAEALELHSDVVEGYFLIDLSARTQSLGLTRDCLKTKLKDYGIDYIPELSVPRRTPSN